MTKAERESRRQQMIEMQKRGMLYKEIAEHFGITAQSVYCAINRPMKDEFVLKEPKHQPAPKITIPQVLKIADKIKQETGRYPSYGKVVHGIENGSIDPWKYIRRKRRAV